MKAQARTKETKKADGYTAPKGAPSSQKQRTGRGSNPNSLQNLKPFQPGHSGNPGGNYKRTPKVSNAYARLLAMTEEELQNFRPANGAEILAWQQFNNARGGKPADSLNAAREVTDRTEGRARQSIQVSNTGELERLIIRVQERILAQTGIELTRDEAVERILAYRPELGGAIE
jgi:hypothetical protein